MNDFSTTQSTAAAPLEEFLRDYAETIGGAWEEVEPQVYDVLIPSAEAPSPLDAASQQIVRVTFDPEALPEHPGAQLASFGTPLIDRWLADAVARALRPLVLHRIELGAARLADAGAEAYRWRPTWSCAWSRCVLSTSARPSSGFRPRS